MQKAQKERSNFQLYFVQLPTETSTAHFLSYSWWLGEAAAWSLALWVGNEGRSFNNLALCCLQAVLMTLSLSSSYLIQSYLSLLILPNSACIPWICLSIFLCASTCAFTRVVNSLIIWSCSCVGVIMVRLWRACLRLVCSLWSSPVGSPLSDLAWTNVRLCLIEGRDSYCLRWPNRFMCHNLLSLVSYSNSSS